MFLFSKRRIGFEAKANASSDLVRAIKPSREILVQPVECDQNGA